MIGKDLCFVSVTKRKVKVKSLSHVQSVTRDLLITLNLLPIFIMKRNAKFQLNVTENKDIIFLTRFIIHMDPTLRKPVTYLLFFLKVCISNYYLLICHALGVL